MVLPPQYLTFSFFILRMLECMGHTIVKLKNPELEFLLVLHERKDVLPQLVFRRFKKKGLKILLVRC